MSHLNDALLVLRPSPVSLESSNVTLTVTHQVHVSNSFVNSLQEEAANRTQQSSPFDESSAWLDAHGNGKPQLHYLYLLNTAN
jgi:hypothetical protein